MRFGKGVDIAEVVLCLGGAGVAVVHYSPWLWLDVIAGLFAGLCVIASGLFFAGFVAWKVFAWAVGDDRREGGGA